MTTQQLPLHPAAAQMVFSYVPTRAKSLANGLVTAAACVGMAATYYVLGGLMDRWDWPRAFLITSGTTLAIACVWVFGTRLSVSSQENLTLKAVPRLADMWRMLGQCSAICITLSYAALGFFQYLFFYWIEYYFETIQQQGTGAARRYSTLIILAMGIGMIGGGWLADRASASSRRARRLVPMLAMIAAGLIFELGLLSSSTALTLLAFVIAAALIGACEGVFWTTVVELGGAFGGTAAGLMNTGGNAGGTLSPYVTPLMSTFFAAHFGESLGWRLGLSVAGVISILGAVLWLGIEEPSLGSEYSATRQS